MCFFDPKLYGNCPYDHDGDISIFNNNTNLATFEGFKEEIEKYPKMHLDKKLTKLKSLRIPSLK